VVWWKFTDVSEVLAYIIAHVFEATNASETSVNYQISRRTIAKDSHIQLDNLPSSNTSIPIYIVLCLFLTLTFIYCSLLYVATAETR
jgi:hypothetical protein